MSQKIQFKVRLNPDVKSQIQAVAERLGISMSALTTKALKDYLARNEDSAPHPEKLEGDV
jgi:predicted transcriptional regulator